VDAGLSASVLLTRICGAGISPDSIRAICLTHDHFSDHVVGAEATARRLGIPICLTEGTAGAVKWKNHPELRIIKPFHPFDVGEIEVMAFPIPHDAADPVGYRFAADDERVAIATDLGHLPRHVRQILSGSDEILLEANYDQALLDESAYPAALLERIGGDRGHLSNSQFCDFILRDLDNRTKKLYAAHLSSTNNRPSILKLMAEQALRDAGLTPELIILKD
jgi:phosphoribosyl 1,2-cyclic phosphodiesterase